MIYLSDFKDWLKRHGCLILPVTNQYELVRWEGKETGVIYSSGKTNGLYAANARKMFEKKMKWDGGPVKTGRSKSYRKQKIKLLERDGDCCFYCGEKLGDDISLEHLIPLVQGGPNNLFNMVLTHEKCNQTLGNKPLTEKINLVINKRLSNPKSNE